VNVSNRSLRSVDIDAYVPNLIQLVFSALMIVALSAPMAPVVPLFVVAPDRRNTAKPRMKESARTAPRRWAKESFLNIRMLLWIPGR
jgi:hypothetical protein